MTVSRRVRWAWLAVGSILAVYFLYSAGILIAAAFARDATDFHTVVDEPVDQVVIDTTAGGSVRVVGTDREDVTIDISLHRGVSAPSHQEVVAGGTLTLTSDCDTPGLTELAPFCSTDYTVQVPADVPLQVSTDGGHVTVEHVAGDLDLRSDGGGITVVDASGAVVVRSDGGGVQATDLAGPTFSARSDGGGIEATFAQAPVWVDAVSDGGSVTLELADDGSAYRLDTSAGGGSEVIDVRTDPASDRHISAHSDGGDVTVRYRAT